MTREMLRDLIGQFNDATDSRTASLIQIELGNECKRLAEKKDYHAGSLLVDVILINGGRKRDARQIWQLFPVLYMLVGDRDGTRLASMNDSDFEKTNALSTEALSQLAKEAYNHAGKKASQQPWPIWEQLHPNTHEFWLEVLRFAFEKGQQ